MNLLIRMYLRLLQRLFLTTQNIFSSPDVPQIVGCSNSKIHSGHQIQLKIVDCSNSKIHSGHQIQLKIVPRGNLRYILVIRFIVKLVLLCLVNRNQITPTDMTSKVLFSLILSRIRKR
jgi:hypothetical protein